MAVAGNPMVTSATRDPPKPYKKKHATKACKRDVLWLPNWVRYVACATIQWGMTTIYGYVVRV
eukprot:scaffold8271_cov171-Amphora_coffeaeformis.AAC.12